jgi:hypothetical protein
VPIAADIDRPLEVVLDMTVSGSDIQVAELPGRRFLYQGLPLRERRGIAGIEAALPHDGHATA